MITDNCKFGFCSEDEICAKSTLAKRIPSFTDIVDTDLTIGAQCELLKNEWYFIRDFLITALKANLETERQFNEQCRKDLHRWFRENEPYINDLARDIVAASRTNFKVFKR